MVDFVLNYEDVLFLRRGEDCFYVRYKGNNKTEFCIPFTSLLEWDKSIEFYNYCKELEKAQGLTLYPEKTNYYKFIKKDDGTEEKVYFNKYDICYSNGSIVIFKTKVENRYVVWNKAKGNYDTASCVVKSHRIPQHLAAILSVNRIPDQPTKSMLTSLMILTPDKDYKAKLNDCYIKLSK